MFLGHSGITLRPNLKDVLIRIMSTLKNNPIATLTLGDNLTNRFDLLMNVFDDPTQKPRPTLRPEDYLGDHPPVFTPSLRLNILASMADMEATTRKEAAEKAKKQQFIEGLLGIPAQHLR